MAEPQSSADDLFPAATSMSSLFSAAPDYGVDSSSSISSIDSPADRPDMFDATLAKVVPGGAGAPHVEPALPLPTIRRPFKLLDLPVDVLKEIIREVPHTNDLSALALTHSALNKLVIPQIYSRFDIVWPDATSTTDTRSGVDALTYGLDTLVKGRKVFFQPLSHLVWASHLRRRGNDYSQYTRKFSLGNGPSEWVQEYHMTKESGKMLNTLVTLAVAPMLNLESFTWDMPTGVVRDVWEALSSLADQPGGKSRLESVWLRCHSAKHAAHYHLGHSSTHGSFHHHHSHTHHQYHPPTSHSARDSELSALQKSYRRIESPNLSILPPMRKVALLDVDEIAYLDELSSLIGRSIDGLRELRLGVASTADPVLWFPSNQKDPAQSHGLAGGVLGFVFKSLYDCRQRTRLVNGTEKGGKASQLRVETPSSLITSDAGSSSEPPVAPTPVQPAPEPMPLSSQENAQQSLSNEVKVSQAAEQDNEQEELDLLDPAKEDGFSGETLSSTASKPPLRLVTGASIPHRSSSTANLRSAAAASRRSAPPSKRRKLQLDTLELANVPLYIGVLLRTVNWTRLTTLTLLNCRSDDDLWKALRRIHAPSSSVVAAEATDPANLDASRYTLQLRRIRTNGVTPALLAVLNETLAPDSLEWLFLQDRPAKTAGSTGNNGGSTANAGLQSGGGGGGGGGAVTVEQIYRGPLRRHRASLRKVMIDSGVVGGPGGSGLRGRDTQRWKRWMLPRDVLKFATSGKMKALRELAVSIDYEDWHYFLRRLPNIPHLRSLHVPHVHRHPHGAAADARELALQVANVVALRPEVELCYLGLLSKCFEVLETAPNADPRAAGGRGAARGTSGGFVSGHSAGDHGPLDSDSDFESVHDPLDDEEDDDEDDDEGEEDEDGNDGIGVAATGTAEDDPAAPAPAEDAEVEELSDDENEPGVQAKVEYQLREILFYSEKVEIFRVRHPTL